MLNNAGELDFDSDDESDNEKMPQPKPLGKVEQASSLLRRSTRISQKMKSKKDAQKIINPFSRNFDYNEDQIGVD